VSLATLLVATLAAHASADTTLPSLQARIAAIAATVDGDVGAAALHLESGVGVATRGDDLFFLASVYKLPIAVALLRRADAGTVGLGDTVRLAPWDFRLGRATLAPNAPGGGGAYTVAELLRAMIADSDNTAGDAILALAGGPSAVTDTLRALGLGGIRIDRSALATLLEFYGVGDLPLGSELTPERVAALVQASRAADRSAALDRFAREPWDSASALAVAELLDRLWRGELLSARSTALLLGHLEGGWIETRLVAGVPPGTRVWHKTGSYAAAATHDAGIVELPDGTHLVVVVLVRQPRRDTEAAERAIAAITRAAWEFWAARPSNPRGGQPDAGEARPRSRATRPSSARRCGTAAGWRGPHPATRAGSRPRPRPARRPRRGSTRTYRRTP